MENNLDKNNNILSDKKPWKKKKIKNLKLSDSYKRLNNKDKFIRSYLCSNYLEFKKFQDGEMKLNSVNSCQLRLCPICNWRRTLKIFSQVSKVINSLNQNKDYKFIFLTLTCRNIQGHDLKSQLDVLSNSLKKMFQRKSIKMSVQGFFRALEIVHDTSKLITKDMYYGNKKKHIYTRKD